MADPTKMQEVHAALRTKHIRTLEVLQSVMEEKEALCLKIKELEGNRGVVIDIEERKEIIAKARAESAAIIKQLEAEAAARNQKVAELERALANLSKANDSAATNAKEVAALKREIGGLKAQVETEQTEKTAAKNQCQDCQAQLTEMTEKYQQAEEFKSRQELEIKRLNDQLQSASEEITALTKERDLLKKSARKMSAAGDEALHKAQAQVLQLQEQEKNLNDLVSKLKAENGTLTSDLQNASSEKQELQTKCDKMVESRKAMREEINKLRDQLQELNGSNSMLDELRRKKMALEEALANEQEQRSNVEEALQTERHGTEQLRNHNQQLQQELARLKETRKGGNFGKFVKVKEENERLKNEVNKAQNTVKAAKRMQSNVQARPSQPQDRRRSFSKR